jgi:uncharacterized protein YggE
MESRRKTMSLNISGPLEHAITVSGTGSIDETAGGPPDPRPVFAMVRAEAAPTPIEMGATDISIQVTVSYLIG